MAESRSVPAAPPADPVVEAIGELAGAIEENARDERLLARRPRRLSSGRAAGRSWRRLLDSEPDPGSLVVVGRILGRLSTASGGFRRALARSVHDEGEPVAAIARRFGVTHQRVSTILRASGPAAPVSPSGRHDDAAPALGPEEASVADR